MKKNTQDKKKNPLVSVLVICALILGSALVGFLFGWVSSSFVDKTSDGFLLEYVLNLLLVLAALYLELILHEGGHLIFGLLTGYGFLSFRIGEHLIQKTARGWQYRQFTLAGTGGQCLMRVPSTVDGDFPFVLYNLGGVIVNAVTAAIAGGIAALPAVTGSVCVFFLGMAISGVLLALMNGLPIVTSPVPNDGTNVRMMRRDPSARRAFWLQLKINENQTEGIRLKDMPAEWFTLPEDADRSNPVISCIDEFAENRLMDAQRTEEAKAKIDQMLDGGTVMDLYKNLLLLDRFTLDALERGEDADTEAFTGSAVRQIRRTMKNYPAVIRAEYACALCVDKDEAKAEALLRRMEKVAARYPVPSDIESEKEWIARIAAHAAQTVPE